VTLLFSVERYEQVMEAYVTGIERRVAAGQPIHAIASVASFFVSRVDTKADALLPPDSDLRGQVAIANAWQAYGRYRDRFQTARWQPLAAAGAQPQRPLWASTGTKDPAYSDVRYVEELIAPDVVNTMPEPTLRAFADHGNVLRGTAERGGATAAILRRAEDAGIDLAAITAQLERAGVRAFCDSYRELIGCLDAKLSELTAAI
jgi:transaldolase